jgi:hypothetical protein
MLVQPARKKAFVYAGGLDEVPPGDPVALHEVGQVVGAPRLTVAVNLRHRGSGRLSGHGCEFAESGLLCR